MHQTTKKAVDDAVGLFLQTNNSDEVLMKSLDYYVAKFQKASVLLLKVKVFMFYLKRLLFTTIIIKLFKNIEYVVDDVQWNDYYKQRKK